MTKGKESWREGCLEVVRLSVPICTIIATPERYHPLVPLVLLDTAMFIIVVRCWTWATEKPSLYLAVTIPWNEGRVLGPVTIPFLLHVLATVNRAYLHPPPHLSHPRLPSRPPFDPHLSPHTLCTVT